MSQSIVLIVDDDTELRLIYRQTLERNGFRVREAQDGVQAMEMLNEEMPDLIILDMMMPRMSGSTVLKLLADNDKFANVRLVLITAYPHFRETAISFNVDQFLAKPVRPSDVVNAVRTALDAD
jgi:CheY-like chemotaxis protein